MISDHGSGKSQSWSPSKLDDSDNTRWKKVTSLILTIIQEKSELEKLRRENASLKVERKKIKNNNAKTLAGEKVCADHLKADALKTKYKSKVSDNLCAILDK